MPVYTHTFTAYLTFSHCYTTLYLLNLPDLPHTKTHPIVAHLALHTHTTLLPRSPPILAIKTNAYNFCRVQTNVTNAYKATPPWDNSSSERQRHHHPQLKQYVFLMFLVHQTSPAQLIPVNGSTPAIFVILGSLLPQHHPHLPGSNNEPSSEWTLPDLALMRGRSRRRQRKKRGITRCRGSPVATPGGGAENLQTKKKAGAQKTG